MTSTPPTRREALARERAELTAAQPGRRAVEAGRRAAPRRPTLPRPLTHEVPRRPSAERVPNPVRKPSRRRPASRTRRAAVAGAMFFVGATIVSTSVPANAYFVDTPAKSAVKLASAGYPALSQPVGGRAGQVLETSDDLAIEAVGRDGYSVSTLAVAGAMSSFAGDSTGAVRWPFPNRVPISSGFGSRRVANCSFCSTNHQGLDFTPGAGTPIQAVAEGRVAKVEQGGSALGYNVWIDHVIDGVPVTTVYAHMTAGSIRVAKGQVVSPGTIVGLVGSTGNSTGAHLHFEVHERGVAVDPYPWLIAHASTEG